MVTDQQVRRLFKLIQIEKNFGIASMKAGMDEKTARKYPKISGSCRLLRNIRCVSGNTVLERAIFVKLNLAK